MHEVVTSLQREYLGCITGTVTDDSFVPVESAKVDPRRNPYAGDGDSTVQTDKKGRFRADRLRPGDYDLYLETEAAGFSLLWVGWLNQPELPKLVRVTVPATGVCKNVTLDMGPRGASLDIVAIGASTQESLSKLIVTVNNSEHSRQGGSAYLVEPREVLVPSHAKFTVQVQADGYRASEPVRIRPLIPGEKKELTIPLRRQLMAEDNTR
jgi:carboxypeptidase family protein